MVRLINWEVQVDEPVIAKSHPKMGTQTCWYLVNKAGVQHKLPQTMIFLGREECDIVLQSRSVDKRHAVITYDHFENKFKVKDLSSLNGTFVNETRILEQTYVKLEHGDTIRFGYDPTAYRIEKVEEVTVTLEKKLTPWSPGTTNKGFPEDSAIQPDKLNNSWQNMECSDRPFPGVAASPVTSLVHPATDYYGYCQSYPLPPSSSFTTVDYYGVPQIHPHISHSSIMYTHSRDSRSPTPSGQYAYSTRQTPSPPSVPAGYMYTMPYPTSSTTGDIHRNVNSTPTNLSMSYNSQQPNNIATVYQVSNTGFNPGLQGTIPVQRVYSPPQAPTPSTQSLTTVMTPIVTTSSECLINFISPAASTMSHSSTSSPLNVSSNSIIVENTKNNYNVDINNSCNTSSKQDSAKNKDPEVLKRGTPLYGQPTWWGDDQDDQYSYPHTATLVIGKNETNNNKTDFENRQPFERPSTLSINKQYQDSKGKIDDENMQPMVPPKNLAGDTSENSPPEQDSVPSKSLGATAFTIDLEDDKPTKLGIHDSLSKFVPPTKLERDCNRESFRHKKSLLAKFDESSKVLTDLPCEKWRKGSADEEQLGKKLEDLLCLDSSSRPVIRSSSRKNIGGGYFSEGYNSPSDPEEDTSIKSDHQVVKKIRSSEKDAKKKEAIDQQIERYREEQQLLHQSQKNSNASSSPKNGLHSVTPIIKSKVVTCVQLTENASYLIDKMFASSENAVPVPPARPNKASKTSPRVELKPSPEEAVKDNVSESGTYTIDENEEIEEARKKIDQVFGVSNNLNVSSVYINDTKVNTDTEEKQESDKESIRRRKLPEPQEINEEEKTNIELSSTMWPSHWTPVIDCKNISRTKELKDGQNSPSASNSDKEETSEKPIINPVIKAVITSEPPRPRRKLPSLPFSSGAGATPSPKGSDASDTESIIRQPVIDRKPEKMDDIFKDTQIIVASMQAKVEATKIRRNSSSDRPYELLQKARTGSFDFIHCTQSVETTPVINGMNKTSQKTGIIEKLKEDANKARTRRSFPLMNWKSESINKSALASLTKNRHELSVSDVEDSHGGVSEAVDNESVMSDVSSSTDVSETSNRSKNRNDKSEKAPQLRFNRAFSLRRKQLGLEDGDSSEMSEKSKTANSGTKTGSITDLSRKSLSSTTSNFSRNDGGRFSLRMSKNTASPFTRRNTTKNDDAQRRSINTSSSAHTINSRNSGNIKNNPYQNKNSNQAKEHELSRWMRRKEYDPMKAAAEGRRKSSSKPLTGTSSNGMLLTRSPSFHGTGDLIHHRIRHNTFSSDEDPSLTGGEEMELKNDSIHSAQIARVSSELANDLALLSRKDLENISPQIKSNISAKMQHSVDSYDLRSSSARSERSFHLSGTSLTSLPLASQQQDEIEFRRKQKIEAMDNLVVSTIHQLSHKVRDNLDEMLFKLRDQYKGSGTTSQIDELLGHIQDKELPAWKSTSRELAAILRNLRRVDQSLNVLKTALLLKDYNTSMPNAMSAPTTPSRTSLPSQSYHSRNRQQLKEEIVYQI